MNSQITKDQILAMITENKSIHLSEIENLLASWNPQGRRVVRETVWTMIQDRRIVFTSSWALTLPANNKNGFPTT